MGSRLSPQLFPPAFCAAFASPIFCWACVLEVHQLRLYECIASLNDEKPVRDVSESWRLLSLGRHELTSIPRPRDRCSRCCATSFTRLAGVPALPQPAEGDDGPESQPASC